MREASASLKEDVAKVRSLRGFTENDKRLIHHLDSKEMLKVIHCFYLFFLFAYRLKRFEKLALSFLDGSYKHYRDTNTKVINFTIIFISFLLEMQATSWRTYSCDYHGEKSNLPEEDFRSSLSDFQRRRLDLTVQLDGHC